MLTCSPFHPTSRIDNEENSDPENNNNNKNSEESGD